MELHKSYSTSTAGPKREQRIEALKIVGISTDTLSSPDLLDAALCAHRRCHSHPFNSFIRKSNGRLSGTSNKNIFPKDTEGYKRDMKRVAIIGGGISGLSAAWELKKKQIPLILFEAAKRCGGAIQTLHEADCLIEAGSNSLSGPHPELDRLITELELQSKYCAAARRITVLLCAMANRLPCLIRPSASCAHRSSPPVLNGDTRRALYSLKSSSR